jgi:hypothetical protein
MENDKNNENNEDFTLLYSEEIDAWMLQLEGEVEEESGRLKGIVIYMGDNKSKKEKEDELIDLILLNDKNRPYYEEIIRIINSGELDF